MTDDHHPPRYVLVRLREVDSCDYEGHALLSDGPHEESTKFYVRRECIVADYLAEKTDKRRWLYTSRPLTEELEP